MKENTADQYQQAYSSDYGFERTMVRFRRDFLLNKIAELDPLVVVEIGCGSELLYDFWKQRGHEVDCWIITEPATAFADLAKNSGLPNLHVFPDFFENAVDQIIKTLPRQPDFVICSSVLHEVHSPHDLLKTIHQIMGHNSLLHVNVPNSESLHRRLAVAMGLIQSTKALSSRNSQLHQPRVYDMETLKTDTLASGFSIVSEGGYFLKPFTHAQMEGISPILGDAVLEGLFSIGQQFPALASEIFIEAQKNRND